MVAKPEAEILFLDPGLVQPLHRMAWLFQDLAKSGGAPAWVVKSGVCVRQLSRADARCAW